MGRPVFGRVLHKEPVMRMRGMMGGGGGGQHNQIDRSRTFSDIGRYYGNEFKGYDSGSPATKQTRQRPQTQVRFAGAGSSSSAAAAATSNVLTPQKGSFQRLKELVWTERARELAQQRKDEEMAARVAVLKEISNGHR